jgi:pimeloyl-ACP methyl ester carboxylesterase
MAPLPAHRFVDTAGGRFAYLELGAADAPPVLYLHGFPDIPLTALDFLAAIAAAGYRVLAPWMRGYSPSTLAGPFDVDRLAADVSALATALAPGRGVAAVGHDWGAVAVHLAAADPGPLSCAVTLAVPHPRLLLRRALTDPAQLLASSYILAFQLPGSATATGARALTSVDDLWRRWSPRDVGLSAETRRALHASIEASWPAPLLYYRAIFRPLRAALARARRPPAPARIPLLHLHGADDRCVLPGSARGGGHLARAGHTSVVLPGLGHFLQQEAPAEVAAHVVDWLARHHAGR